MWAIRLKQYIFTILILCASFYELANGKQKAKHSELDSNELTCRRDEIFDGTITYVWKQKYLNDLTQYATSHGELCLDNSTNKLLIRKCDPMLGKWFPSSDSVNCAAVPKQSNTFCPEDLIEISVDEKFICVKLSSGKLSFTEDFCYGSDTFFGEKPMKASETETVLRYLSSERGITHFWLPVRRASFNLFYNPLVKRLPGYRWGEIYDMPISRPNMQNLNVPLDCVSADIVHFNKQISFSSRVTDCAEKLPMVCIHRTNFVAHSGCPQGFGALAHKPNECYGIELEAGLFPYDLQSLSVAEYVVKRITLRHIFSSVGLNRERFFLIGNFSDQNDSLFDIEMNSKEELRILPSGKKRLALSSEFLSSLNRKSVEMVLGVHSQLKRLTLTIYNRNYIWRFSDADNFGVKCFSNSEAENVQWKSVSIKLIWQNILETKAIFEVEHGKNDGYYWCEAHSIFNFALIKTEKILFKQPRKGHTYVFFMDLPCQPKECYNIHFFWKKLNEHAKKTLNHFENKMKYMDLEIDNVRLMDIKHIDNNSSSFRGLIHVSAFLRRSSVDQDSSQKSEEYNDDESEFGKITTERMVVRNLLDNLIFNITSEKLNSVRSTSYCFPDVFYMKKKAFNYWRLSKYGEVSTTVKLCLDEKQNPVIRRCFGDFLWGAVWDSTPTGNLSCYVPNQSDVITHQLSDMDSKKLTKTSPYKTVKRVRQLIESHVNHIIPADFYYLSRLMRTTMKSVLRDKRSTKDLNEDVTDEIARVYNKLLAVNEHVVKSSALLNTTNVLLEAFERVIDNKASQMQTKSTIGTSSDILYSSKQNVSEIYQGIKTTQYEDIGVELKAASNFLIFMLDPAIANVTGVALYRHEDNAVNEDRNSDGVLVGSFKDEFFRFILSNQSVDDLLYEKNLLIATYMPQTLWNRLDEISQQANITERKIVPIRIVIKIYANDILFQQHFGMLQPEGNSEKVVAGKIVSVSIPGHDRDLPEMMPLIFKTPYNQTTHNSFESSCSYWNYKTWVNDGLMFLTTSEVDNSIVLCGCTHLTPFAYLIGESYKLSVHSDIAVQIKSHVKVLDFITILGCSLSLCGTLGIFITAVTFQSWRQKASSKVLLQLSSAICLQMVLFCFVNTGKNFRSLMEYEVFNTCIAIGALLHYSVLVQFCWMIIIGYLQFKRYVKVFGNTRPKRFVKKSSLIGWGTPLIPVSLVLIFDRKSYVPDLHDETRQGICYPSGYSLYFAVILPIIGVIVANFIMFFLIVYNILRVPEGSLRHTEKGIVLPQLRLSVLLFFLLGFTWVFGLLSTIKAGIIFSYLFCFTATLQGFVIFIYFVILDPKTRRMWSGIFANAFGIKESFESSLSMKEASLTLR